MTCARCTTPNAPEFLRALADLLEQHQATLGYSNDDRGVEIDVAGVEVAAIWCIDTAGGASALRAAADRLNAPTDRVPMTPYRHSTFAELERQARRLRREAAQANRGLPDFIVTSEELDEIRRANGGNTSPAGTTFHGMKLRVVYP